MRKHLAIMALALLGATAVKLQAAVISHEGFDYVQGTDLNGQNWWTQAGGGSALIQAGLTYPGLAVTGGSVNLSEVGNQQDALSLTNNYYVSVLIQKTSAGGYLGINFNQGWNAPSVAGFGIHNSDIFASDGGYAFPNFNIGTTPITTNAITLLVAHVDDVAHTITAWDFANPSNTATFNFSNTTAPATIEVFSSWGGTGNLDEITVGTTLADVTPAPEPASLGLLAVGSLLALRRRVRA